MGLPFTTDWIKEKKNLSWPNVAPATRHEPANLVGNTLERCVGYMCTLTSAFIPMAANLLRKFHFSIPVDVIRRRRVRTLASLFFFLFFLMRDGQVESVCVYVQYDNNEPAKCLISAAESLFCHSLYSIMRSAWIDSGHRCTIKGLRDRYKQKPLGPFVADAHHSCGLVSFV